ncbi:hypothetical protein AusDCA_3829 [Desulfitobacterium sp. AusDCA]
MVQTIGSLVIPCKELNEPVEYNLHNNSIVLGNFIKRKGYLTGVSRTLQKIKNQPK